MKKYTLILAVFQLVLLQAGNAQNPFKKIISKVTSSESEDTGTGLKEALEIGVKEAVDKLSIEDGYYKSPYKIILPEEALMVTKKLKGVPGFANAEAEITEKINRAAEDAAKRATPIFVNAIKGMSFEDATRILMGENDAATNYLHKTTYEQLYKEFKPVILNSLNKFNAVDYWAGAVSSYNKIPFAKKANPELDDYVTQEALKGLFALIKKKEAGIRTDVSQRTSELLKTVFGRQD